MRFIILLIISIINTALPLGCSSNDDVSIKPFLLSLSVTDASGASHLAQLDKSKLTATIESIRDANQVRKIKYSLSPNTTVSPDLETLTAHCDKENIFTLTSGNGQATLRILFPNIDTTEPSLEPDAEKWQLAWSEEFNGNTFNSDVWSKVPRANPDWSNTMAPYDDLFEVKDGILTLWGKKNTSHPEDASASLTGGLWSKELKDFKGGRFDIRAYYDYAKGFWPALWLRPQTNPNNEYIEIDILEHVNTDNIAHQTVHSDYTMKVDKVKLSNTVRVPIDTKSWHIYSVEIHEDKVVFLIDNKETYTYPKLSPAVKGQFPFYDCSFYLILSAQLGGKWAGEVNFSQLPVRLQVDYIKYYLPK